MTIKDEYELYEPVKNWLNSFLSENVKTKFVRTYIGANETLCKILLREPFAGEIENLTFFDFKIDVFSVVEVKKQKRLVIVECKKDSMGLIHLGQLIGYSQIIKPWRSILLSPQGANSSLKKFISVHKMDHLLSYGTDGKITICDWDIVRQRPTAANTIPVGSLDPISFF